MTEDETLIHEGQIQRPRQQSMEWVLDLLAKPDEQQKLLQKMRSLFEDLARELRKGQANILIQSANAQEGERIVQALRKKYSEDDVMVFDFTGPTGAATLDEFTEQIKALSSSREGAKIVLFHPEASLDEDRLLYLRAVVHHEKAFSNNQAIMITNKKELDRKGGDSGSYASNIYDVSTFDQNLGLPNAPLMFDESRAKQVISQFAQAFQSLRNQGMAELFLPPRSGKSTLLTAFVSWWTTNVTSSIDSLPRYDSHLFLNDPRPFDSLRKDINFVLEREKMGAVIPLVIIDEAQDLTTDQRALLSAEFPEQKFFFIGHT